MEITSNLSYINIPHSLQLPVPGLHVEFFKLFSETHQPLTHSSRKKNPPFIAMRNGFYAINCCKANMLNSSTVGNVNIWVFSSITELLD